MREICTSKTASVRQKMVKNCTLTKLHINWSFCSGKTAVCYSYQNSLKNDLNQIFTRENIFPSIIPSFTEVERRNENNLRFSAARRCTVTAARNSWYTWLTIIVFGYRFPLPSNLPNFSSWEPTIRNHHTYGPALPNVITWKSNWYEFNCDVSVIASFLVTWLSLLHNISETWICVH